jgi:hypothetical protein
MWCDALTPALRAVIRRAVRWRRGAPAPVLVGAACALGWWAGWRRACWVGGQFGGPHIGRASRAVLGVLEAARDGARVYRWARGAVVGSRCAAP